MVLVLAMLAGLLVRCSAERPTAEEAAPFDPDFPEFGGLEPEEAALPRPELIPMPWQAAYVPTKEDEAALAEAEETASDPSVPSSSPWESNAGDAHLEGDIAMTTAEYEEVAEAQTQRLAQLDGTAPQSDAQENALRDPRFLWRDRMMPFHIDGRFGDREKTVIWAGMREIEQRTCLRFRPKNNNDQDWVHIIQGSGCWSRVGRSGGRQELSLGNGCVYHATVIHELIHAAGFFHEQSRYDRDDWVTIRLENVSPGKDGNFKKHSAQASHSSSVSVQAMMMLVLQDTKLLGTYDYSFVMHYSAMAFSKNKRATIEKTRAGPSTLGNDRGLSAQDAVKINMLYGCNAGPQPPCSQWGWRFYDDGWDLKTHDIGFKDASHRNDCQPLCRQTAGCRAYTWASAERWAPARCYLKSAGQPVRGRQGLFSATIC